VSQSRQKRNQRFAKRNETLRTFGAK